MCDNILATPVTTLDHAMLFGKNSDRYRNEAQTVEYFPRAEHGSDAQVQCTYVHIAQVHRTYATLLCRPFWTWGAEMGVNEHGVVIGNEGLFARSAPPVTEALIGMDLVRLALERAKTARQAVDELATLLERHGQGGNCGHLKQSYYNNGFMIADCSDAFILETLDRDWFVERVADIRSMSNIYSVGHPERTSRALPERLRQSGWTNDSVPNYAEAIADPQAQHIGDSASRRARSTALLRSRLGQLDVEDMISILRDHEMAEALPSHSHPKSFRRRTLCLHAGSASMATQTTGSLVSKIGGAGTVHWVTGTAAPCISIFKPVLMDVPLPVHGLRPTDRFDARTLWWRHELLHRAAVLGDFASVREEISSERDALERDFRVRVNAVAHGTLAERSHVVDECWARAHTTEGRWLERIEVTPSVDMAEYAAAWDEMNRIAGIDPLDVLGLVEARQTPATKARLL